MLQGLTNYVSYHTSLKRSLLHERWGHATRPTLYECVERAKHIAIPVLTARAELRTRKQASTRVTRVAVRCRVSSKIRKADAKTNPGTYDELMTV